MARGSRRPYETLLHKEPEAIERIASFRPGETLWDIGANVGLNGLQDLVTRLYLALAKRQAIAAMKLASVVSGKSMCSFGGALDFRDNAYIPTFRQGMAGHDIDSLIGEFSAAVPIHVKVDVNRRLRDVATRFARHENVALLDPTRYSTLPATSPSTF